MKSRTFLFISLNLVFFLTCPNIGWAQAPREETEKTAQQLATLLNVGRLIVERNQTLINDPRIGDKGLRQRYLNMRLSMSSSARQPLI